MHLINKVLDFAQEVFLMDRAVLLSLAVGIAALLLALPLLVERMLKT